MSNKETDNDMFGLSMMAVPLFIFSIVFIIFFIGLFIATLIKHFEQI